MDQSTGASRLGSVRLGSQDEFRRDQILSCGDRTDVPSTLLVLDGDDVFPLSLRLSSHAYKNAPTWPGDREESTPRLEIPTMGPLLSLVLLAAVANATRLHSRHTPLAFSQPLSRAVELVDPYVFRFALQGV